MVDFQLNIETTIAIWLWSTCNCMTPVSGTSDTNSAYSFDSAALQIRRTSTPYQYELRVKASCHSKCIILVIHIDPHISSSSFNRCCRAGVPCKWINAAQALQIQLHRQRHFYHLVQRGKMDTRHYQYRIAQLNYSDCRNAMSRLSFHAVSRWKLII